MVKVSFSRLVAWLTGLDWSRLARSSRAVWSDYTDSTDSTRLD